MRRTSFLFILFVRIIIINWSPPYLLNWSPKWGSEEPWNLCVNSNVNWTNLWSNHWTRLSSEKYSWQKETPVSVETGFWTSKPKKYWPLKTAMYFRHSSPRTIVFLNKTPYKVLCLPNVYEDRFFPLTSEVVHYLFYSFSSFHRLFVWRIYISTSVFLLILYGLIIDVVYVIKWEVVLVKVEVDLMHNSKEHGKTKISQHDSP